MKRSNRVFTTFVSSKTRSRMVDQPGSWTPPLLQGNEAAAAAA